LHALDMQRAVTNPAFAGHHGEMRAADFPAFGSKSPIASREITGTWTAAVFPTIWEPCVRKERRE
jgi:hypothetical protein